MDQVRERMRTFLRIEEAPPVSIRIRESLDYEANAVKNRVWYRGDSRELIQLYDSIGEGNARQMFWAARSTPGMEMRKIHTGLPAMITDTLAGIVVTNLNEVRFRTEEHQALWERIAEENGVKELIGKAVTETLVVGDGAFKISLDPEVSDLPVLEFWPGDRIDYTRQRGRITEVVFRTPLLAADRKPCELREIYGPGYIRYRLTRDGKELARTAVPALEELEDVMFGAEECGVILAAPLRFFPSGRWEGRGQSVFDRKTECFDAFDEAWSQWMDALRAGRTKVYIPECFLPRDPHTGAIKRPNAFDDRFIRTEADLTQNGENVIHSERADIAHEAYAATYAAALDQCLQGLISPATLGVDVKKLDNAEAQREKEKVTLYTRSRIVEALQTCLKVLAETALAAAQEAMGIAGEKPEAEVSFGDYGSPSFDSQAATVAAAVEKGVMSVETAIEELYGDTRSEAWKAAEAERIRRRETERR